MGLISNSQLEFEFEPDEFEDIPDEDYLLALWLRLSDDPSDDVSDNLLKWIKRGLSEDESLK
jgi:hypothetical protein